MGADLSSASPQDVWHDVEMQLMDEEGLGEVFAGLDEDDFAGINAVFEQLGNAIVAILERGLRALCSLFVLSALGYEGTTVGAFVRDFVVIRDEDLGSRRYAQHLRRPH